MNIPYLKVDPARKCKKCLNKNKLDREKEKKLFFNNRCFDPNNAAADTDLVSEEIFQFLSFDIQENLDDPTCSYVIYDRDIFKSTVTSEVCNTVINCYNFIF